MTEIEVHLHNIERAQEQMVRMEAIERLVEWLPYNKESRDTYKMWRSWSMGEFGGKRYTQVRSSLLRDLPETFTTLVADVRSTNPQIIIDRTNEVVKLLGAVKMEQLRRENAKHAAHVLAQRQHILKQYQDAEIADSFFTAMLALAEIGWLRNDNFNRLPKFGMADK